MEGRAARIVRALKFGGWFGLAPRMAREMSEDARRVAGGGPGRLVPVPLAPARRRERGFDQAALLADGLARELGWPRADLLVRPRAGRPQARLGRDERLRNVRGAFRLRADAADGARRGPPVLLVDDVVSTGATAVACAEVLASGGVRLAGVVSFARA